MASISETLQEAIRQTKMGEHAYARQMFREVVRLDPKNETAWLWLIGLLESTQEQIEACRTVLEINPNNDAVKKRLQKLEAEVKTKQQENRQWAKEEYRRAKNYQASGQNEKARDILFEIIRKDPDIEPVWWLLSKVLISDDEKIEALTQVLKLNPKNTKAAKEKADLELFHGKPLEQAARFEEEGQFDLAIQAYIKAGNTAKSTGDWDTIYKRIEFLKKRRTSGIVHVHPAKAIIRLSPGMAMTYFAFLLIHTGFKIFSAPIELLIGLGFVALGGFLLTVASIRTRHIIWEKLLGKENSRGTPFARFTLGLTGWVCILLPYLLMFNNAVQRSRQTDFFVTWWK